MADDSALAQFLDQEWLDTYESQLDLLWSQSVDLNASLYLLEKIADFPFNLFAHSDQLFWVLAADAFYEKSVLAIWRIAADTARDALTLSRFKNELVRHAINQHAKDTIKERLRAAKFDDLTRSIIKDVTELRHLWLGHFKREVVCRAHENKRGMPLIPLGRLKAVRDAVNEMIGALTLVGGRATIYMEYSGLAQHPAGMDPRPDIEKILDQLADASVVLRMPETQPEYWRGRWEDFTQHDRNHFNNYRERNGLGRYGG